jgi:hypothetical protein
MKNSFRSINAQVVQVGEAITNTQPLVVDLRGVRKQLSDALARGEVAVETGEELGTALDEVERELAQPNPRPSRVRAIIEGMTALTSGLTASAGLVESVDSIARTITGAQ